MNVLAIETATDQGGAALLTSQGGAYSALFHLPRRHGELLPGCVGAVLSSSGLSPVDLDLVAVDIGPGSFTGLRIGIAFARALAQAHDIPLVGVRQTEALGLPIAAWWPGQVAVWIHDRRDFVYHAWVTRERAGREVVQKAANAVEKLRGKREVLVVGSGAIVFSDLLRERGVGLPAQSWVYPDPVEVARLGLKRYRTEGPTEEVEPLYVQPPLAGEKEA